MIGLNEVMDNDNDGILMCHSNGNEIYSNVISDNQNNGITFLSYSLGSIIKSNVITKNTDSEILLCESSTGNKIVGNTITKNYFGIQALGVADDNVLYNNNFIGNSENAFDSFTNLWDNRSNGNYWDDYEGFDDDK